MRRLDKMTKMLLGLIAFFLGLIALAPILKLTPEANAQTGTALGSTTNSSATPVPTPAPVKGVVLLTRIVERDPILGMQTMDNTGVFFVWTQNTVEVYRVN